MKKLSLLVVLALCIMLCGCVSTSEAINPASITYQEITIRDFIDMVNSQGIVSLENKGFKITDVFIVGGGSNSSSNQPGLAARPGASNTKSNETDNTYISINSFADQWRSIKIQATDYSRKMKSADSTFTDRINTALDSEKYNGHFTLYVYGNVTYGFLSYTSELVLYKIDGIPSQEQLDADIAAEEAAKAAEEAERLAKEQEKIDAQNRKNAEAQVLAEGYIYHGIDEAKTNQKLFAYDTMEVGHAYYIPNYVVKLGGDMGCVEFGDGFFVSNESNYYYVNYASNKVKMEVIEAGINSLLGQTIEVPIDVVVTKGTDFLGLPLILGVVE